jgi:hypothetical protein
VFKEFEVKANLLRFNRPAAGEDLKIFGSEVKDILLSGINIACKEGREFLKKGIFLLEFKFEGRCVLREGRINES